ncbi:CHAT domain-containing protein [Actinomadura sp. KC06]|uniref:CHAT domain-containing protein n=1 Tax=Actinomadura sp. KC06 TaxID=2530369 RepID=UPI00104F0A44|nr:CHAT domain-containing protein [Actinomadura sp. KC06]TDD40218.1 CHAT domain-containing protein [Actinomadura sp. KC06]
MTTDETQPADKTEPAELDDQIARLRAALDAPFRPDVKPAWIRLALAEFLVQRGERAQSIEDLDAAIEYTRHAVADLGAAIGASDLSATYENLGVAHLLRGQYALDSADEHLAEAAAAFRRSIDLRPGPNPDLGWVNARYGVVLATIAQRAVGGLDLFGDETPGDWSSLAGQVTTALETLDAGWRDMAGDDPYRPVVRYWRAVTRACRFTYFGGDTADRDEARADLDAILGLPECDDAIADICHLYLAFLHLFGSAPAGLRDRRPTLRNFARLLAGGNLADAETARAARDHLDRVTGTAPESAAMASGLRAVTVLAVDGGDITAEGLTEVLAGLGAAEPDPEDDELGPLRDLMETVRTVRRDGIEDVNALADAITRIGGEFGEGHPFQQVLQGVLGQLLDLHSDGHSGGARSATPEEREAALELLENVLTELPDDHPDRAATLGRLGTILTRGIEHRHSPERLERVRGILLEAVGRPAADTDNEALNNFLLVVVDRLRSMIGHGLQPLSDAVERLQRVARLLPREHPLQQMIPGFLASVLMHRHLQAGGLEHLDAADHYARLTSETFAPGEPGPGGEPGPDDRAREDMHALMEWFRAASPMARATGPPDAELLDRTARAHRTLAERLPEGHPSRTLIESSTRTLEFVQRQLETATAGPHARQAQEEVPDDVQEYEVETARALGADHPLFPTELGVLGFRKVHGGYLTRNLDRLDEGLALMAEAYGAADPVWPLRSWLLGVFGWAFLLRYEIALDRVDLNNAIDRLEAAVRAGETGALGSVTALSLAVLSTAYHLRGDAALDDRRRAGETGLAALRARAWSVMLQSSTERAFTAALAAAGEGAAVAYQCTADGYTGSAVEALEWGRAMVLHTATTDANLPALLRDGGHDDLAAEWEEATGENGPAPWDLPGGPDGMPGLQPGLAELRVPSDLRERVMEAIEGSDIERRLFSPAVPAEIGGALRESGAAALAYLVPREDGRGGLALVVDDAGEVRPVRLPRLMTGPRSRVDAFVRAQHDRERAGPGTDEAERVHRRWRHALGDLCDWAWTAVMEPVLDAAAGGPGNGNRARVVLVPVGELGAVPWHAARRTVGDGVRRYACQDAVVSYAASARQFIEARRHGHRPWPSAAALVRVGGSSPPLYWALKEIEQIHRRHYPDGELLGGRRRPGEARAPGATAANVRELLPGPESGGASLLHLGCHAHPAPRPVDSHLMLAGGGALGMTDILRRARVRPPGVPGGLVVLAACGSDLTSRDHDEALTLSTAFLAAGAVGVVGARWPVDDLPTALFMTLFHHYLNAGYDDPAVALRAAQLWMLNPRRRVPADLSAELADLLDAAPLDEPESWAAFTYQGR